MDTIKAYPTMFFLSRLGRVSIGEALSYARTVDSARPSTAGSAKAGLVYEALGQIVAPSEKVTLGLREGISVTGRAAPRYHVSTSDDRSSAEFHMPV